MPAQQAARAAAAAAARWPGTPGASAEVLQLLLKAGADPMPDCLPRLLQRYERTVTATHPTDSCVRRFRAGLAAVLRSQGSRLAATGSRSGKPASAAAAEQHCQLLLAAIFCRDAPRCLQLIAAGSDSCWRRHASNGHLLVAAAEHDLPAVVAALLALRIGGAGGGGGNAGDQPFSLDAAAGLAHEGCTPLMTAAERNSCAALRVLLKAGAAVNQTDEDGVSALHWAVIGGSYEAAELLLQRGARCGMRAEWGRVATAVSCHQNCTSSPVAMPRKSL
jgi:hypothetical protein